MPIHPTAIVDPSAKVHESAVIGPYVIIGADVTISIRRRGHADTPFALSIALRESIASLTARKDRKSTRLNSSH